MLLRLQIIALIRTGSTKSTPNPFYVDAETCLRVVLHSSPPVLEALLPLIQVLVLRIAIDFLYRFLFHLFGPFFGYLCYDLNFLLGDKLKDALSELEKICHSSTTALPFRSLRHHVIGYRVKQFVILNPISHLMLLKHLSPIVVSVFLFPVHISLGQKVLVVVPCPYWDKLHWLNFSVLTEIARWIGRTL